MTLRTLLLSAMLSAATLTGAAAQEAAAPKGLDVELNALAGSQKGCLFTFVAANGFEQNVSKVSFEFVIFNDKGTVELTVSGMIEAEKVQAPPPGAAIV